MHLLFRGLVPAGALVAGAIAEVIGIRYTLLSGALCYLLSTLWLIFSPIRHLQKIPEVRKT